jgi:hypothetical protein
VRIAAAASDRAATNAASDLVPLAMTAAEALRWSRTALVGAARFSPAEITARVAARFPATTLPVRPALDEAIVAAGLPFTWSDAEQVYLSTALAPAASAPPWLPAGGTVLFSGGSTAPRGGRTRIAALDRRPSPLLITNGGFLACVPPTDLRTPNAGSPATRLGRRLLLRRLDTFLRHLREAGAVPHHLGHRGGRPGQSSLDRLSIGATIAEVATRTVVAWYPGALASCPGSRPWTSLRHGRVRRAPHSYVWLVVLGSTDASLLTAPRYLPGGQPMDGPHRTWPAPTGPEAHRMIDFDVLATRSANSLRPDDLRAR